ncbi:hypothetical protein I4F81_011370 [Pyropia yezoensis]|uniref:Uncharacterized protein n=1 Tax=Pyropia yezoensis TaxID=2788 RepID=A0ACC3CG97_PYRYE|nr:hypothetical protein I4F81_011370 [Neopyropia yezoensis]
MPVVSRQAAHNASGSAGSEGWDSILQKAYEVERPPLPTEEFFTRHDGLFTLWVGTGLATGRVLLGVPVDRLTKPFVVSEQYSTSDGETATRHSPAKSFDPSAFAFRKSDVAPDSLELYRPPLNVQSAQPGSPEGRETTAGLSVSGLATFPYRRSPAGLLVIDAGPWVAAGFFTALHETNRPVTTRFVGGASAPEHITLRVAVSVELGNATTLSPEGIFGARVTVTIFGLPDRPMRTRPLDERIGFFAAPFAVADAYTEDNPTAGAHIARWDLSRRGGHLDWYVDPSVPRANWAALRAGVLMWNAAFGAAGFDVRADTVLRVHLPTDSDWPADYAADDARFLVISFVPQERPSASAPSVYDPRTGEILWATVVVHDDLPRLVAAVHRQWLSDDPLPRLPRSSRSTLDAVARGPASSISGHFTRITSEEYVAQILASFSSHELGHALGLRHHFKASATVPWAALVNGSYVESFGLSASVMDYPPRLLLLPSSQAHPQRYFASPVVGIYDKAAIRYGYDRSLSSAGALNSLAEAIAAEGLAVASDGDVGFDALAIRWDLSDDPLAAWDLAGAALNWVLAHMHPVKGLLSASTAAAWAPALSEETEECRRYPVGCVDRWPMRVAESLHATREQMLDSLTHPLRLGRLASSPWADEGVVLDAGRRLTVATLLSSITQTLVGDGWSALRDADDADAGKSRSGAFVAEAVARWVARLAAAAAGEEAPADTARVAAPAAAHERGVRLAVAGELSRMAADVATAMAAAPGNVHLQGVLVAMAPYRGWSPRGE